MTKEHMIAGSADVAADVLVGEDTRIWHLAQVREGARIGAGCTIGRGAYVDAGVRVADNCKIQNYALVYAPAAIAEGVFIGPGAVITNDRFPRAINPDGSLKAGDDWSPQGVRLDMGVSIGSQSVVVAGVVVGAWAVVGAGSVVTRDVPPHALVVGSPARRVGWVGRSGHRLVTDGDTLLDLETRDRFREVGGVLEELQ